MTSKEKKEYLSRYRIDDGRINDLLREKAAIRSRLESMTASYSGMPHGSGYETDKLTSGVAKLIELDKEIDKRVDELVDFRREIEAHIAELHDPVLERVLTLRYIDGFSWSRIHVEMAADGSTFGAAERWIYRIHGKALTKLKVDSKCQ